MYTKVMLRPCNKHSCRAIPTRLPAQQHYTLVGSVYRQYKPPITTKPPHQNTYNHDSLTVRRLPTTAHLLFDAPAATHQPTPSHIWHLINLHRAAIALAGSPYPPLPCVVPIDHPWPSAPSRAPVPASLPSKPLAAVRVLHRATSRWLLYPI